MSPAALDHKYIAVEGVIGVGKSSFCELLAERLDATPLYEPIHDNPFLADFYRNRKRHAFACQLYFLISRYQQQQQLQTRDLFAQRIVADYIFAKDSIFASVNLSERELALYNRIAPVLAQEVPRPDLVIYLQASTSVLMDRINKRDVRYERSIDHEYIDLLNRAYDYFFFHYNETPLLVVKTDEIDFVNTPEHFDDLIDQLSRPIAGKIYYVPAGGVL